MALKRMTVKEFRELGLLQETNRLFLHPMGLALEVIVEGDGEGNETVRFGEIWDEREDPVGIFYEPGVHTQEKAERVLALFQAKQSARIAEFGTHIQQFEGDPTDA